LNDRRDISREDRLKDYVEVNVRIEKFYEKYPNGRIITEILSWENGVVVMKASVYRDMNDEVPSATGHAYEKEGSTFINKTSALENCETSAVGRALAMLGFEIRKSVASREEVANAMLNQEQEEPTEPPATLKAKYEVGKGSMEGFDEWVARQKEKGMTYRQMEEILAKALLEKQKEAKRNAQQRGADRATGT